MKKPRTSYEEETVINLDYQVHGPSVHLSEEL